MSWQLSLSWNEPYFHSAVLSVAAGACRRFKSDSRQILSSPWWVKWSVSMLCGVWLFPPLTSPLERFYTKLLLEYWKCSVSCARMCGLRITSVDWKWNHTHSACSQTNSSVKMMCRMVVIPFGHFLMYLSFYINQVFFLSGKCFR